MIDFPNGLKPIIAGIGIAGDGGSTFDWINCQGIHKLHCIVVIKRAVSKAAHLAVYNSSNSAAGGTAALTSTGISFWYNKSVTPQVDRLWEQTASQTSGTNIFMVAAATGPTLLIGTLDCAVLPTSKPWVAFAVMNSSNAGNVASAIYLAEPRYPGYQQFVATTSSTD